MTYCVTTFLGEKGDFFYTQVDQYEEKKLISTEEIRSSVKDGKEKHDQDVMKFTQPQQKKFYVAGGEKKAQDPALWIEQIKMKVQKESENDKKKLFIGHHPVYTIAELKEFLEKEKLKLDVVENSADVDGYDWIVYWQ